MPVNPEPETHDFDIWTSRMRWMVWIRWWALLGLIVTAYFARLILGLDVPWAIVVPVAGILIVMNVYVTRRLSERQYIPRLAIQQVLVDLAALSLTLFSTGGFFNPFFCLYFYQIMVSRIVLSQRTSYAVLGLTAVLFLALAKAPELNTLDTETGLITNRTTLHAAGGAISFILTAIFTAYWVSMLMRDLSEKERRVQTERDRRRQYEKLAALGKLAGGVAHEINTPLGTIAMEAEDTLSRLRQGGIPDDQLCESLNRIRTQTKRCSAITRSLLKFARQSEAKRQDVQMPELIDDTLGLLGHRLSGISIDINNDEAPLVATADPDAVRQIILNLVNNALDALETYDMDTKGRICISCREDQETVSVEVEDNGPGIPEDLRDRIFEPFFTTKQVDRGTGLGLAISYSLARNMGGGLELIQPNKGACRFRLWLPVGLNS